MSSCAGASVCKLQSFLHWEYLLRFNHFHLFCNIIYFINSYLQEIKTLIFTNIFHHLSCMSEICKGNFSSNVKYPLSKEYIAKTTIDDDLISKLALFTTMTDYKMAKNLDHDVKSYYQMRNYKSVLMLFDQSIKHPISSLHKGLVKIQWPFLGSPPTAMIEYWCVLVEFFLIVYLGLNSFLSS